ncbi:transposase [Streptomyces sp. CB01635]|uniref:RNA-guided endonuclease InsQ/TnpB family protein n=1 Tax=unclassified Streptomyces TaxID=2593676 RepID=UPI000C280C25|nr:RNA-guided endonuclease TnpB family protein [Streptomyces sp. CB01635]PJN09642.1 transposase [Streptomyces sp. CB01635]
MIRAYKFVMRPTVRQAQALGEMLRDHCSPYNGALQERRDAYRHASKTSIKYGQLKDIRAFDPERQGRWSFSSQQATLRRLDKAFAAFFRRVKSGEKPGYPRFRGVNWFDTVEFAKDGDGCRWDSTPHDPVTRVCLQGVGHVKVHQHRAVAGKVKTISVKREGRKWFLVLSAEQVQPEPLPATGAVVGIDLGIASFLADSSGGFVPNPRHGAKSAAKLEAAQQALCKFPRVRRDKRTANHRRAVEKVAKLHRKVRRQRLDHAGVFLTILAAKAESAGREVIAVDPRNTSRQCPECGHTSVENRPAQEKFHCVSCGHRAHADTVGATNVLRAGLVRREAAPA